MASKVQANLIKVNCKLGNYALAAKIAILANLEHHQKGLFIDNAYSEVVEYMTPAQWAGALSALTKQGFYSASTDPEYKGKYGYVNIEK